MIDNKKVTAIILIAGNSTRYGQNRNKNFEDINGRPVFSYSLKEFDTNSYVDDIILAVKADEAEVVKEKLQKEDVNKEIKIVVGGSSRAESVYNSIKSTNSDIVIIHDGARAAIKQEYISKCIEEMDKFKGATVGVKAKDTIKITDDEGVVIDTTKRSNTWIVQTPQCFDRNILLEMHEKYKNEEVTDDCMMLEKGNYKIKILQGDYTNIKITTYEDLDIIKGFFK